MTVAPAMSNDHLDPGYVRLEAYAPLHADASAAAALLSGDPSAWLGDAEPRGIVAGLRRYEVDLRLDVGNDDAPIVTLRKAAYIDLGIVWRTPAGYEVEIGWRASSAAPLFPVFSGRLSVGPYLSLDGLYAPPGGVVGRVADRVLLHTAANGTARWVLRQLAEAARP